MWAFGDGSLLVVRTSQRFQTQVSRYKFDGGCLFAERVSLRLNCWLVREEGEGVVLHCRDSLPDPGQVRPQVLMASSVESRLSAVERVLSVSISKLQAGDFDI